MQMVFLVWMRRQQNELVSLADWKKDALQLSQAETWKPANYSFMASVH